MKPQHKDIAWLLLQPDHYMMITTNVRGKMIFKVYHGNKSPVQYFSEAQVRRYKSLFKVDHKNKMTLNLSKVRQLRGNNYLKKLYKKTRSDAN